MCYENWNSLDYTRRIYVLTTQRNKIHEHREMTIQNSNASCMKCFIGTQGTPWKCIQYSNYTKLIIDHVSCGYSCCCSVGRLVVTPPISRRSRSGLSSHVSFRSLVLTWCVRRRRGRTEEGRGERVIARIHDIWKMTAHIKNEMDRCTKETLPARCDYLSKWATWLPLLNGMAAPTSASYLWIADEVDIGWKVSCTVGA